MAPLELADHLLVELIAADGGLWRVHAKEESSILESMSSLPSKTAADGVLRRLVRLHLAERELVVVVRLLRVVERAHLVHPQRHPVTDGVLRRGGRKGEKRRREATRQSASATSTRKLRRTRVAPDSVGRAPCDRTRPPRTPRRARTPPPSEAAPEDSSPLKKGRHRPRRRRTRRLTTHEAAAPHNMHATACVRTTPAKTGARFRRHATCHAVRLRRPSHILTSIMAHAARAFAVSIAPRSSPRLRARRGCLVAPPPRTPRSARTPTSARTTGSTTAPPSSTRKTAPPGAPPIVILPGFGNNTKDYVNPFGDPDVSLVASLRARGWACTWWTSSARTGPRSSARCSASASGAATAPPSRHLVPRARRRHRARRARRQPRRHSRRSRGALRRGWLARAYIGGALNEVRWDRFRYVARDLEPAPPPKYAVPHPNVRRLVTLGTRNASRLDRTPTTRHVARFDGSTSRGPERRSPSDGVDTRCVTGSYGSRRRGERRQGDVARVQL